MCTTEVEPAKREPLNAAEIGAGAVILLATGFLIANNYPRVVDHIVKSPLVQSLLQNLDQIPHPFGF